MTRRLMLPTAVAAISLLCLVGFARVGSPMLLQDATQRPACPVYPRALHASSVHFTPGLAEHLNWIDFSAPPTFKGYFAFCLDGHLLEEGGGELDFQTRVASFTVSTMWVDVLWLGGQLDGYRDEGRWELRLLCDPPVPVEGVSTFAQPALNSSTARCH